VQLALVFGWVMQVMCGHVDNLRHGADSLTKVIFFFFGSTSVRKRINSASHSTHVLNRVRRVGPLKSFMFMTGFIGYFHQSKIHPNQIQINTTHRLDRHYQFVVIVIITRVKKKENRKIPIDDVGNLYSKGVSR